MRIAMVVHSYYPSDVRVRRECEALADRGDSVDVICLRRPEEAPLERIGNAEVHRLPVEHRRGQGPAAYVREYLGFFFRAAVRLTVLHIRRRYPVIQVHNMPDFLVFVTLIPRLLGARVLLDMHDITPELYQSLYGISEHSPIFGLLCLVERLSLAYADAVLTVNKNIRDLFLTRNPIAHKIEVVMNAPDPRYFVPGGNGSGASAPNGGFRLFHHGQVLRRYNFEVALEAFAIARQQIPNLHLDIYGDGEEGYVERLRRIVSERGLDGSIEFHGRVPVECIPGLIRHADIGLVPCRKDVFVDRAMLPVRLLEYIAMGLPAVVARTGTVEAYFGDDAVAYYHHDDPRAMAERIVELHRDPVRRADFARRARVAIRDFEWPRMQERYYRVVDSLAAR